MRNVHEETLEELKEISERGISHLRRRTREHRQISPIVTYSPQEIKELREKLQFTQTCFGELLGVSLKTIQAWESGTNRPNGTALRVFQMLESDPKALDKYVFIEA